MPRALRILIVCTGNICRSPTAEAVLRRGIEDRGLAERIEVDSCGTHGYHVGEAPDPRAVRLAASRGYDMRRLVARQLAALDFERFDLLLAMDRSHQRTLLRLCPPERGERVRLFLAPAAEDLGTDEVPDPYYGGAEAFEQAFDLIEIGARALLDSLQDEVNSA
jgi:protein-tyrosine phosphatase